MIPQKRAQTRAALNLAAGEFVVLHIGAFNAQKNQAFLIGAFFRDAEAKTRRDFAACRRRRYRASCETLAARLGVERKVRFLGWREDIPALLSAADAFALPSLHEGLPLTLVEAQCAGLWCLASDRVTKEARLTPHVTFCPIRTKARLQGSLCGAADADRAAASEGCDCAAENGGITTFWTTRSGADVA